MTELTAVKERRRESRAAIARPVYVEAADSHGEHFEELRTTRDLSRWGFYFQTEKDAYRPGMQVRAIPAFGGLNLEYVGEVVRVETLSAGEFGVAVQLLRVHNPIAGVNTLVRSVFDSFARATEPLKEAIDREPRDGVCI
jgi:hypothetical protein